MQIMSVILDNRIGGISIRAMAVAERLRAFDIETLFILPIEPGNLEMRAVSRGFKVKQIIRGRPSLKRPWANVYWLLAFPFSVLALIYTILREKVDIVHVNGLLNLQAPIAAVVTRRKIVWHLAGTIYPQVLVRVLMPFIRRVAFVITISETVDRYFCGKQLVCRRKIVREPVDLSRFSTSCVSMQSRQNYREHLGVSTADLLVGTVGNINPAKGYVYLLRSIPMVLDHLPNTRFVVVGAEFETQSAYISMLHSLVKRLGIENQVTFLGQRNDIPELLASFDLFVLPSVNEGTPLAIMEAMAMEKPVVATNVGGVLDVVVQGETGIVVTSEDPCLLADAIVSLLRNPSRRIAMGKKGRQRVEKYFTLEACTEAHKEIYETLLLEEQLPTR